MKKIVVLISGSGSNLQSIIEGCQSGTIKGRIVAVVSNQNTAYGLVRAQQAGIPAACLDAKAYSNRQAYDAALLALIEQYQPDLVVLAGFMRILSPDFVTHFTGKLLNIHPSLLPKYPGLHTHRKALENGDKEHGTSVHFVTEELDGGPVILQAKVPIFPEDTEADLIERVKTQEHTIYPLVVQWFSDNRLTMVEGKAVLDGKVLPQQGYANE
ncbi:MULTISPECIES: phosphoribosylglycinamide formyltransferase [Providencia]|uniref:phosphoribosylglycinamide formyltransferase n=1 Tax=Providencia TaxID=586 RepID=UPI00197EF2E9|nr:MULTISPECIES: phosphoribosylglycinamide formyltransferase [Providencia]HEC8329370.1 phosphoribosylglycinamide formyltransferase [Providencia rettgeri]MBN4863355.1 phosphoribosylglycinamide formyltransferase [Providencia stuartii]MBN4876386.1 phosphoribosylglycinamide formyltransferase [Providencia stuartii]MBN4878202.1 phosphoribosylglycinamide formyltransferase [Providencia stuartii]MBN4881878.1 phosphoribosylglycinamide formyltransferase [Providencia stuartii]